MSAEDLPSRLRRLFLGELEEHGALLLRETGALEADGDPDHLRVIFRAAHTLKGAAHAAGVEPVERLCHRLETLLADVRDAGRALGPAEFRLLYQACDSLTDSARRLAAGESPPPSLLLDAAPGVSGSAAPAGTPVAATAVAATAASVSAPAPPAGPPRLAVDAARLDQLLELAGELRTGVGVLDELAQAADAAHGELSAWAREWRRARGPDAVEALRGRLAETVQSTRRLAELTRRRAGALERTSASLGREVLGLRLQPVAGACEGLARVARDVARAGAKEVTLVVQEDGVVADRTVVAALRDILVQLVRNAVDHGLETPAERVVAGKPRAGAVSVEAGLAGGRVRVSVADDGGGVNFEVFAARLRAAGAPLPRDERGLLQVLLHGGTSTKEHPTEYSGRGVGLDVVYAAVRRLGGAFDVETQRGRGTRFVVEFPPSPILTRAVIAEAGGLVVAVPSEAVERMVRLRPEGAAYADGHAVVPLDGGAVPVVALAPLLDPALAAPAAGRRTPALVLRARAGRVALATERLLDERDIMLRPLSSPCPLLTGAALVDGGRIALVVDGPALAEAALAARGRAPGEGAVGAPRAPRVLVVDDSLTTRALEESVLRAAGYEVVTAADGEDAWRIVQQSPVDLVVSDVEMPRMDGLELCAALRRTPRLAGTPVILVSGLETPEQRVRGLAAGADAYIAKSSFDQRELLDAVRQLAG